MLDEVPVSGDLYESEKENQKNTEHVAEAACFFAMGRIDEGRSDDLA